MPEDDKFVKAATFLKNAKPGSTLKMSDFFAASEAKKEAEKKEAEKKAQSSSMSVFFEQAGKRAAALKAAKEQEEREAQAAGERDMGWPVMDDDGEPMPFTGNLGDLEEKTPTRPQKSLYREVRDVLYTDGKYESMSAVEKRLADIRVLGQIVRARYVERKREAREWFNHTKFGQAVARKSEQFAKWSSARMDAAVKNYLNLKTYIGDGVDATRRGLKAGYQFTATKAKAAKDWFVNTAAVQTASRKMRKFGARSAEVGRSVAHGFRKLFGIRELTEEEKKARIEEKQKASAEKEAKKKQEKDAKEKLKAEKKAEKEFQQKLKAFKKAIKAEKNRSVAAEMEEALKEATVNGLSSLGDRYDKLMKAIDLSVQSKVQKDDIDEIIRRRMDKGYDERMRKFKRELYNNPDIAKKLKHRLDSNKWRTEFEAAKKRAEEEKKKKQNGGKLPEEEEKKISVLDTFNALGQKGEAGAKALAAVKKGQIGNAADYVKALQNFETAFANLQTELKKKREEEEKKKAEAEAKEKGEEKTEAKTEEKTEAKTETAAENTEKKEESKSALQEVAEKTKEIANATVNVAKAAFNNAKTGVSLADNVGSVVDNVQKLVTGQGNEQNAAEAVKKSTAALKQAGSFFGWDPSKSTASVDKGADTLALLGKTREELTKRMEKIKNGTAEAEDYVAFETNLTTLAQNCLSYAKIDTPYITSFNKALTGMVEISKGKKLPENILNVGQQLLSTANAIEKQIAGAGSLGTPITVLDSMEKIAGNMEELARKTKQNQNLMAMTEDEMGKNLPAEDANMVRNGRDDIVGRNEMNRYQLLGGAVKKAAETTVSLVGGTIGTLYVKAAQPAFDALHKYMTEAMQKSLDEALIQKDLYKEKEFYWVDKELGGMRNDEIMRLLRRETGSINGQHLADKIRLDLGMRLMNNEGKDNGFEALVQNAFGRKATDEEILQLVGFKDFDDADKRVYKAAEKDNQLRTDYEKKGKDVLAQPSKEAKEQARKDKLHKNTLDRLNDALDSKGSNALTEEDEPPKRKMFSFQDDSKKNVVGFTNPNASKKNAKGLKK